MRRAAAALAVVTVGVAGCSGNHENPQDTLASTSPSARSLQSPTLATARSSPDRPELGQEYLRIVGPANVALAAMTNGFPSVPASATGADIAKITDPAADAIDRADEQLLRVAWPPVATVDVKTMVTADATVANDLRSIDGQDALSVSAWETQLAADAGTMAGTVAVVRAELGLPPTSSASCADAHCY